MKKLLLIAGFLFYGAAYSNQWLLTSIDSTSASFVDLESVNCNEGSCNIWWGRINIEPEKPYDTQLVLYDIKCKARTLRISALTNYLKGDVKNVQVYELNQSKFYPVVPGTLSHKVWDYSCNQADIKDNPVIIKNFLPGEVEKIQKGLREINAKRNK